MRTRLLAVLLATASLQATPVSATQYRTERKPVSARPQSAASRLAQSPEGAIRKLAPSSPSPSKAEIAIATARAQIGKPYRYGSTGPNSFDCSGLTSYAWRAAGVEIPRTSAAQFSGLPRVSLDAMQPGDLVYSRGHIGLYIGDGQMINSPRTGRNVEISPLHRNLIGAVRPG